MKRIKYGMMMIMLVLLTICFCGCQKDDTDLLTKKSVETEASKKDEKMSKDEDEDTDHSEEGEVVRQESERISVYICGQVNHPGVYELKATDRIVAAIELAGGLTKKADETAINQASFMEDGQQIVIPAKEDGAKQHMEKNDQKANSSLISINQASKEELMNLPGIGEAKAGSIISYREEHGSFAKIEDLMNISGIKEGVFNKIKDYITL